MLEASRAAIGARLASEALVLDVGAGASPHPRADWVLDLMAYGERGAYGPSPDPAHERFGPETWVQRDICDRERWPFADRRFDFSICSHTLEDVRDPLWVCGELIRVSRAGYIEVPSRLEEQSYGFQGPWAGWGHHRWLIDVDSDPRAGPDCDPDPAPRPDPDPREDPPDPQPAITFVAKHHVLHNRPTQHFPAGFRDTLTPGRRVQTLWWTDHFTYRERIFTDGPSLDAYLEEVIKLHLPSPPTARKPAYRLKARRRRADTR